MTQFQILSDAIDLWKNRRRNAAKAQWNTLTAEFRGKVLDYTTFAIENYAGISSTPNVEIHSPKFGNFNFSKFSILELVEIIPELA